MDSVERDRLIFETANDVKWIKEWTVEHKKMHSRYVWYFISIVVATILSWLC